MKIKGFERIWNKWLIGLKCPRKTHMWQINSGMCYFSEVSGSPVDGTFQNISSKK